MTIQEATAQLIAVTNELNNKLPDVTKAETAYNERYYTLYLQSPRSTDSARQAEAKAILIEEGLHEHYFNLKVDIKILYNKKDMLTEVSKNLRSFQPVTP